MDIDNDIFSVGVLYDTQELLRLIPKVTSSREASIKDSFKPRLNVAAFDSVLELSQTCNWFSVNEDRQLVLTSLGQRIVKATDEYAALRIQIKSYVTTCRPAWAMLLVHGRASMKAIPSDSLQCLEEAGFLALTPSGLKAWDQLAALAEGHDNNRKNEIGRMGEYLTKLYEEKRTGVEPRWIALETDSAGYDFISRKDKTDATRMPIEVKASERKLEDAFVHISKNEWEVSQTSKNYAFYFWLLKNPLQLFIVQPKGVLPHSPGDQGDGSWESVKIPFVSFTKGKNKNVKKIQPAGISLEDVP
jgi:hypothetical protein